MITIVDPCLFPVFCCSLSRFLFISQQRRVFNYIPVDYSTSCFSNSIFALTKYLSSDILCTLRHCQCFSISTPTIATLTIVIAQISVFDNRRINNLALAFLVSSADTASDSAYFT